MDTFPASPPASPNRGEQGGLTQEISTQPIAVQQPSQKKSLRKFLNISSWVILFAFLPISVLIFLSQDSIPGDFFYPVKRGMENVILAAASVNPATRAAFRTDLTATRFKEAQHLIVSRSNTSGLTSFIDDIRSTKQEVTNLKNDAQRDKAEEKLLVKIEEYQSGLSTLEAKTEQAIITYQPQEAPTLVSTSTPTPLPSPLSQPKFSPTSPPSGGSIPTSVPTLTLIPTVSKTSPTVPPQQDNVQVAEQKKIAQTIKEAKEQLHKIKKDVEEKRNEDRQKDSKRGESETPNETPDRQNKFEKNTD